MKNFIVLMVLFFLTLGLASPVYGAETTVVTTTEEENTTTEEEVTTTEGVGSLFDEEGLMNTVQPKIQLAISIVTAIYVFVSVVIILKQRVSAAVEKARNKEAQTQLSLEQRLREIQFKQISTVMDVLNIIVQNSKLKTEEKISVSNLIAENKKEMDDVIELASQITNIDKKDISDILDSIGDISSLVTSGMSSLKTGDLSSLNDTVEELKDEEEGE